MNNNAFFEEELLELKFLGIGDSDIEKLSEVVNKLDHSIETIINMSKEELKEYIDVVINKEDKWIKETKE